MENENQFQKRTDSANLPNGSFKKSGDCWIKHGFQLAPLVLLACVPGIDVLADHNAVDAQGLPRQRDFVKIHKK